MLLRVLLPLLLHTFPAAYSQTVTELEATYDELGLDSFSRQQSTRLLQLMKDEGLEEIAHNNSCGFWVAIRTPNASIVASVGYSEVTQPHMHAAESSGTKKATLAKATDVVPSGSLMKSMTAAAIMRLVDNDGLDLDDSITQHVNPYLQKFNR